MRPNLTFVSAKIIVTSALAKPASFFGVQEPLNFEAGSSKILVTTYHATWHHIAGKTKLFALTILGADTRFKPAISKPSSMQESSQ
jgi:hypothetical protein